MRIFALGLALAVAAPTFAGEGRARKCFTVAVGANSKGTNALFARRHLQGGGPTWRAILETAVKAMPSAARTPYDFDDEGDAALFCTDDAALMAALRAEYRRLNSDAKALAAAIDRVPPGQLE